MIQIQRERNGFKVSARESGFGTFIAHAQDAEEAAEAVRHYYGNAHSRHPGPTCPFCRLSAREQAEGALLK